MGAGWLQKDQNHCKVITLVEFSPRMYGQSVTKRKLPYGAPLPTVNLKTLDMLDGSVPRIS